MRGRIKKELIELKKCEKTSGVACSLVDDSSLTHLTGTLKGPSDSPYEGGTFKVDIKIPDQYPFEPPKMQFTTKLWHPNVSSQTGAICLDILKDQWSPALTLKTAMLSLQALMSSPEPNDPQDAQVASQYLNDYDAFDVKARQWTQLYAGGPGPKKDSEKGGSGSSSSGGSSSSSSSAPKPKPKPMDPKLKQIIEFTGTTEANAKRLLGVTGSVEAAVHAFFAGD